MNITVKGTIDQILRFAERRGLLIGNRGLYNRRGRLVARVIMI